MKRTFLFLLAVATLGMVGCNRHAGSGNDIVVVNKGQMSFYNVENKELTLFKAETDSVVDLLFADRDHLCYRTANDQGLLLKMIDLSVADPKPVLCIDWNLIVDETVDCSEEEWLDLSLYRRKIDLGRFFTEDKLLYHVTPEGKTCLNDKIDWSLYFEDEAEKEELGFTPVSLSPDGSKVVYSAVVYLGEGWGCYFVSNIDGTEQYILDSSDIWFGCPEWLADGSLVYATSESSIKLVDPQGNAKTLCAGDLFAVRPAAQEKEVVKQAGLLGCDVALFDNGRVTFYNSETKEFVPFMAETDSVINGVFVEDLGFFYTVKIGEELYLKEVFLSNFDPHPMMLTDWDLTISECVSETYGKASTLACMPSYHRVGINHNFSWDFYNFSDIKFYDYAEARKLDGWSEDEESETDLFDDDFLQFEEDLESFFAFDGNYYYCVSEEDTVCLSDKINFMDYVSDPAYYDGPEFSFYSIDPTRTMAAYCALIEWGDLGHGPLCIASLDGSRQMVLKDTDASDLSYGWLPDGSLLYVGVEPRPTDDPDYDAEWNSTRPCVRIVSPDGTDTVFSQATDFVVSKP